MLILGCSGQSHEKKEIDLIKKQAEFYGIHVESEFPKDDDAFFKIFQRGIKYDYIFLSAHGSDTGFSNENETIDVSWIQFSELLFNEDCLNSDSHILLSCCRGGLNDVAFDLIYFNENINIVVGPKNNLDSNHLVMGFNTYLYNVEIRQLDPIVSAEKIKLAFDLRFMCFDSIEVKTEPAFLLRYDRYEVDKIDIDKDGEIDEIRIRRRNEEKVTYTDKDSIQQVNS